MVHVECDERRSHDGNMQQHTAPATHMIALARAHALHDGVETLMWCVCALEHDLSMLMTHGHMHMTVHETHVMPCVLTEGVQCDNAAVPGPHKLTSGGI